MVRLQSVTRGKFRQLVTSDGLPVVATLYACVVDKAPYLKNGKTYVCLDTSGAVGDLDLVRKVDAFVDSQAKPDFSPVWGSRLVVKMPATLTYATDNGEAGPPFVMNAADVVDVEVTPGAFGKFGYCWLMRRVKPHKS